MNVISAKKVSAVGAAPLRNINILNNLVVESLERHFNLPGMVGFSGPSGFGKSTAASYIAAEYQAAYVEIKSMYTRKALLEVILTQLGVRPEKVAHRMLAQAGAELAASRKPLILDEFDHAVRSKGMVELVRDLYELCHGTFILIGEENLPHALKEYERFDGRILNWAQAEAANLDDARALNNHYAPDIRLHDDLLEHLVELAYGSIRRIVTNLDRIAKFARAEGMDGISRKEWGPRPLYMASAPAIRRFGCPAA